MQKMHVALQMADFFSIRSTHLAEYEMPAVITCVITGSLDWNGFKSEQLFINMISLTWHKPNQSIQDCSKTKQEKQ